jgi:hypothetical protein
MMNRPDAATERISVENIADDFKQAETCGGLVWQPRNCIMFKKATGDWTLLQRPSCIEVDFYHELNDGRRAWPCYEELMGEVRRNSLAALQVAYTYGIEHVLFRHGCSISRIGKSTARSVVRGLMQSKTATPYIVRIQCVQHESVFLAAIRPNLQPDPRNLLAEGWAAVQKEIQRVEKEGHPRRLDEYGAYRLFTPTLPLDLPRHTNCNLEVRSDVGLRFTKRRRPDNGN